MSGCRSASLHVGKWVAGLLPLQADGFERCNRISVKVYRPGGPILRLCEVDGAAVKMHLTPCERILLGQPHPCIDGDNELGNVFRKPFANDFAQAVVFLACEEAQSAAALSFMTNLPCWIRRHF
jgi:hypothetical protein